MSGSLVLRSGVGTQMLIVSRSATTSNLVVADRRPALTSAATSAEGTSGMYDSPREMAAIFRASRSMPVTLNPQRANSTASGSPTYPRPTTPTCARRVSRRWNSEPKTDCGVMVKVGSQSHAVLCPHYAAVSLPCRGLLSLLDGKVRRSRGLEISFEPEERPLEGRPGNRRSRISRRQEQRQCKPAPPIPPRGFCHVEWNLVQ